MFLGVKFPSEGTLYCEQYVSSDDPNKVSVGH